MHEDVPDAWGGAGCMRTCRMHGEVPDAWGGAGCMRRCRMHGEVPDAWGGAGCMGRCRMHGHVQTSQPQICRNAAECNFVACVYKVVFHYQNSRS